MPSASSAGVTNLGATKATFNGSVTSNGNQTVTSDGFDWGTSTAYGNTAAGSTVQTGSFSANLTGLTTGQTYHYRAKAVNSLGTGFSGDTAFTPSPTPTPTPGPTTGPYKGTAAPVPGLVYASNYDLGGQGVGYQDSAKWEPRHLSNGWSGFASYLGHRFGGDRLHLRLENMRANGPGTQ